MNIKYIAQQAGVSTATVSRVLNNSKKVKGETRSKVQNIINENGYTPSAIAQSLSVQKTRNVGFVTPDIPNPFSASVLAGVASVAENQGYDVFVFNSDERSEKERRILDIVKQKRLDGVIISPVKANDELTRQLLEELDAEGISVVQFDRKLQNTNLSSVLADNEEGAYEAVNSLVREGHQKIGIIEGDILNWAVKERIFGYCKALVEADIPIRSEYMVPADQRIERAYEAAKKLMESADPPTAIFTCNNFMTLGCIKYFTEKGIVIGRDISLVGFDDVETLNIVGYQVSVVDQNGFEMGQRAMEILLRQLDMTQSSKEHCRLPVQLILRGSEKLIK